MEWIDMAWTDTAWADIAAQTMIQGMWLALYHYYLERICELEKGRGKRITVWGMSFGALLAAQTAAALLRPERGSLPRVAAWLVISLILFLYVLFYDARPLREQWWKALVPGILCAVCGAAEDAAAYVLASGAVLTLFLLLLNLQRGCLRVWVGVLCAAVYGLLSLAVWRYCGGTHPVFSANAAAEFAAGILAVEILLFAVLEGALASYHRGYENRSEVFQRDILGQQYKEIREIYLDMRGWRHDYHNHLQVMKAQLAAGRIPDVQRYLDELEQDLDRVDATVKSGNLMTDAILNSKLTLARKKEIRINCKAVLPAVLTIEDVDLCVLLGNLLDNALEACDQIPADQRFLRIYMAVNRSQLYISVQNSAKEELNFNERNYITQKRGSHGLGMKRVKALTDKYEGYLTLANEPGIFAAEVTLPL